MKKAKVRDISGSKKYSFRARIWKYNGTGGWHFVTLPKELSKKIRKHHGLSEEGWGRLKTTAHIGKTKWSTAVWYDSKFSAYLLPIKSTVRKAEKLEDKSIATVVLIFESTWVFIID